MAKNVSALLGQKLLAGWTMLADACPQTDTCPGVPLMRDPSGRMLCVSCSRYFVKEADAAGTTFRANPAPSATPSAGSSEAHVAEPTAVTAPPLVRTATAAQPAPAPVPAPVSTAATDAAISRAEGTLLAKLDELASALAAATSPREIARLAKAIRSTSRALADVRAIPLRSDA